MEKLAKFIVVPHTTTPHDQEGSVGYADIETTGMAGYGSNLGLGVKLEALTEAPLEIV